MNEFKIGQAVKLESVDSFSRQLEDFINNFEDQADEYRQGLIGANEKYGQDKLIETITRILV